MRVLLTGSEGQLGLELQQVLAEHTVLCTDLRSDSCVLDITDFRSTMQLVGEFRPELVIHSAALTNVDGCERDPDSAYLVNALGTQNVALACQQCGSELLYLSTDYVFDGEKKGVYLEFDPTNPVSTYGRSKLAGEQYVQMLTDRFYIVRTAWLYSPHGSNFVKWALTAASEQREMMGVTDQIGCPTNATDLARAIADLILTHRYGIYHLTNEGACSRYELLCRVLDYAGLRIPVAAVSTDELLQRHPLPARRPKNSALRNYCASRALGIRLRHWDEALRELVCTLR